MDRDAYRDFVLEIYQAVPEPSRWTSTLDRMCEHFRGRGIIVFEWEFHDIDRKLVTPWHTSGYDEDILASYLKRNQYYEEQDQDIYERQLLSIDGIEIISEDVLYTQKTDYLTRPHVKELREYGIRHRTGSLLDKDNPFRSRFSLQLAEGRSLGPEQHQDLLDLLPHIAKAMDVGRPIASPAFERRAMFAILDKLQVGICLLDALGRVILRNTEFNRQMDTFRAFQITPGGTLRLAGPGDDGHFERLLQDALNHGRCGARPRKEAIALSGIDKSEFLCVEVVPLHRAEEIGTKPLDGAILISRDTSRPSGINLDLVQQVYSDLTSAELAVIELICQGFTNPEIADRRERSVDTVNAQVKSILAKSRASNRTQLVRMLGNFSTSYAAVA